MSNENNSPEFKKSSQFKSSVWTNQNISIGSWFKKHSEADVTKPERSNKIDLDKKTNDTLMEM